MRKIATLVGIVTLMTVLVMSFGTAGAVFADPPLPEGCFKERRTIYCTEEGKIPKFNEENSKEGSFRFSHPV